MNEKDKAAELVEKFMKVDSRLHGTLMFSGDAKQCAIICCEEVLSQIAIIDEDVIKRKEEYRLIEEYDYWSQVKAEIEKL